MFMSIYEHIVLWAVFVLSSAFSMMYRAVLSAGSEHTPWKTTKEYFLQKPISNVMQFLVAQLGYFVLIYNPWLVNNIFDGIALFTKVTFMPYILSSALGLASERVADVVTTVGQFVYNKFNSVFGAKK